jgi:magnesium chelatase family protein
LFFDECNCFAPAVLDALREPLEQGSIRLSRGNSAATFPPNFIFAAAINPCPCGNYGNINSKCKCTAADIIRFKNKLTAPILDRIELQIQLDSSTTSLLDSCSPAEASTIISARVMQAREFQRARGELKPRLDAFDLTKSSIMTDSARALINKASARLGLSNRAIIRLANVARTIANLKAKRMIAEADIAEAFTFRLQN